MTRALIGIVVSLLVAVVSCSSESDLGEDCDRAGGTGGVCEDGSVCGWPSDKSRQLVCIPICEGSGQCPKDAECKDAVDKSSIKGCRFKD